MKKIKIFIYSIIGILIALVCGIFLVYQLIVFLLLSPLVNQYAEVKGVVRDTLTHKPIAGARMKFHVPDSFSPEFTTTTDSTGFYEVSVFQMVPKNVWMFADGYKETSLMIGSANGKNLDKVNVIDITMEHK